MLKRIIRRVVQETRTTLPLKDHCKLKPAVWYYIYIIFFFDKPVMKAYIFFSIPHYVILGYPIALHTGIMKLTFYNVNNPDVTIIWNKIFRLYTNVCFLFYFYLTTCYIALHIYLKQKAIVLRTTQSTFI